jgi:hypothetical protein
LTFNRLATPLGPLQGFGRSQMEPA